MAYLVSLFNPRHSTHMFGSIPNDIYLILPRIRRIPSLVTCASMVLTYASYYGLPASNLPWPVIYMSYALLPIEGLAILRRETRRRNFQQPKQRKWKRSASK